MPCPRISRTSPLSPPAVLPILRPLAAPPTPRPPLPAALLTQLLLLPAALLTRLLLLPAVPLIRLLLLPAALLTRLLLLPAAPLIRLLLLPAALLTRLLPLPAAPLIRLLLLPAAPLAALPTLSKQSLGRDSQWMLRLASKRCSLPGRSLWQPWTRVARRKFAA